MSSLVHGAELRVAETRAVNRALRKAYGIGLCSAEELGWVSGPTDSTREDRGHSASTKRSVSNNGQPRLRDRLCLLIRQHQLDPVLVKRYAANFCGTQTLRDSSRELVESFVNHLAEWAARDREGGEGVKRHIPGLHREAQNGDGILEGLFLVRVERVFYRWHPQKPFFALRLAILEPKEHSGQTISGRLYCTRKALWKLNWFLRDFAYDTELLGRDEVDEKALLGLQGVVRVSRTTLNGRSFLNLDGFAPAGEWEELSVATVGTGESPETSDDL